MKKSTLIALALSLSTAFPISNNAQDIYVSTVSKGLYQLDLNNCVATFVVEIEHAVNDISFHPNGKLYGLDPFGDFFEINTTTGAISIIHKFNGQVYNSLTVHSNGRIYATGNEGHLWSYDLSNSVETYHGDFGFSAAGDLTFYKGNLYVAAVGNNIILIDIDDPAKSEVVITEDFSTDIYGIVSYAEDCNNFHSYAITGGQSKVYEIDFDNNELALLCQLNISIGGGASTYEFLASYSIAVDNAIKTYPTCFDNNGAITLEVSGGDGLLEYSIDGINFQSSNSFSNLAPELYTFVIQDENGCQIEYEVDFAFGIPKIGSLDLQNATCDEANGSITVEPANGIAPLEYSIDGINFQSNPLFENLAAQNYTLTIQDQFGCKHSKQAELSNTEKPELILVEAKVNTCGSINGKIEVEAINGTPPYAYSLDPLAPQSEGLFEHLPANNYQVNILDDAGCQDSLQVQIEKEVPPIITEVKTSPTSCGALNGQVNIEVMGGKKVRYSINQGPYQEEYIFSKLKPGQYRIDIKDANHCSDFSEFEIESSEAVFITKLETEGATCGNADGALHLEIEGNQGLTQISLNQQDFNSDLSYTDLTGGFYQLLAQDERGCEADSSFSILQEDCPFYIPNAFSPNGDGTNDVFQIHPHPSFEGTFHSLNIFNRWGGLVYQLRDFDPKYDTWDGRIKGKMGAAEVYTYYLELNETNGAIQVIGGSVNLVR